MPLSSEEEAASRELLALVGDLAPDDENTSAAFDFSLSTAIRFLRARNMDVGKAEIMFRDAFAWRNSFGVKQKAEEWQAELNAGETARAQVCKDYWFGGVCGFDKLGVPVNLIRMGRGDPAGVVRECGYDTFFLQHIVQLESGFEVCRQIEEQQKSDGKPAPCLSFVEIYDMAGEGVKGYNSRAFGAVRHFISLAKTLDTNYPERVGKVFVVRAPWLFAVIWKMIKPVIPAATQAKISIFGGSGWIGELRELVDDEQIPMWLLEDGGRRASMVSSGASAASSEEVSAASDVGLKGINFVDDTTVNSAEQTSHRTDLFPGGVVPKGCGEEKEKENKEEEDVGSDDDEDEFEDAAAE